MTLPEGVMLPNELERRQIFYTLKRWSSYTAWQRILDFYQSWADAMEKVVSTGEALPRDSRQYEHYDQVGLGPDKLVSALKGLADVDDGVARLRMGDKRVFRYASYGEFIRGGSPLDSWNHFINHFVKSDGWPLEPELIPYWPELDQARDDVSSAWGECGIDILQEGYMGEPTEEAPTIFGVWLQEWLPKMTFPYPLPEAPSPVDVVLVGTRGVVPCSGIWEPVDAPAPKMLSFSKPPPPKGPFPIVGCMNYLHGGSRAPRAKQETEHESLRANVTWRLLWKDTRYEDGTIPEEENHYVFLHPESQSEPDMPVIGAATDSLIVAHSGQSAPVAGRWLVEGDLFGAVQMEAGQELPMYKGRKVRWVLSKP